MRCAIEGVVRCPGCGLELPAEPGSESHRYFNASAECWGVFGEVLADDYGDPLRFAAAHQLSVDSYAAQHAGGAHPDKSVAIHLVGLHLVLEAGLRPTAVPPLLQTLATVTERWPALEPPPPRWMLTVEDVALADEPVAVVRAWAGEVWQKWADAHGVIRRLASVVRPP